MTGQQLALGMTLEEFRAEEAKRMTEAQLQARILGTPRAPGLADTLGWLGYHTRRSDRSPAGFPDLVLVRRGLLVFAELKRQAKSAKTSPAQDRWLDELGIVAEVTTTRNVHVFLWRPMDLLDGTIAAILK